MRPLNVKAKLILAIKPRQENFQRPMFDIKIDLDAISLNVNQNQVELLILNNNHLHENFSIRIYLIYLNSKIILAFNQNI